MAREYYTILGVPNSASQDDVKKAYTDLAKRILMQRHSAKTPEDEASFKQRFRDASGAFVTLSNADKRQRYDQFGTECDFEVGQSKVNPDAAIPDGIPDCLLVHIRDTLDPILNTINAVVDDFAQSGIGGESPDDFRRSAFKFAMEAIANPIVHDERDIHCELTITKNEAKNGTAKRLSLRGKRLDLKLPPGVRAGHVLKLRGGRAEIDGCPGDILVTIKTK